MIKSKVFDVIRTLSKDELKKFGEYLSSPVFNKREIIFKLFSVYKKFYPQFDDKNLTKEKVYKKLFPGKKYNDTVFRNLNSLLLKHSEDFLSFINYQKDPFIVKRHLLNEINVRNILTMFEKNFEEGKKILETTGQRDMNYFINEHNLFFEKDTYNSFVNSFSKEDILHSEKSLIVYFILKLLEIQSYILYHCRLLGLDKPDYLRSNFTEKIIKELPEEILNLPQVQIYYNALMLEQTQNEKFYGRLKQLLVDFGNLMEKDNHYNKYMYMIGYIKRTRTKSDIGSTSEIFQLRKRIVENNLILENFMTNRFYLYIVKSGLKLGEFSWIDSFIRKYNNLLIPKFRESTKMLSLALFHFERKEYDEALSYASKVKYEDSFYSLEVKNLTAKIYYEKNDYDLLAGFIMSYRMYIAKNRSMSKAEFNSHHIFLNFIDKLLRIKEKGKIYKIDDLILQINKNEFLNKVWILEKISELEV